MPKINFNIGQKQESKQQNFFQSEKQQQTTNPILLERTLRKKRSTEYLNLIGELDVQGVTDNKQKMDQIIDIVHQEFPEIELGGMLLGFISKCYLGEPYEVHTISYNLQIINHYKSGEPLPDGMEKARSLAAFGNYRFIEVYTDCCRAVADDGSVSVIKD
ncbi:hypothetical protein ACYSNW_06820 [Enterococcus sp. LJL99]